MVNNSILIGAALLAVGTMAGDATVGSIVELEERFVEQQYTFLPIAPPTFEVFTQSHGPVIAVDWVGFPDAFKKQMYAQMDSNGFPLYPVWIYEDPITRETVFLNAYDLEAFRLKPEVGYDPYAWQRVRFGLEAGDKLDAFSQWIYDPAHVAVRFNLLPQVFHDDYLGLQQAAALAMPMTPMAMMMSMSAPVTNIMMGITGTTNGTVEVELHWPTNFTDKLELFSATNLVHGNWQPIHNNIITMGTNYYAWEDGGSTNYAQCYYQAGNAELDTDGDLLTDAREIILYGTSENLDDTDFDGLDDGWEVGNSTDPLSVTNHWKLAGLPDLPVDEPTTNYPPGFAAFDPPVSNGWHGAALVAEWIRTANAGETVPMASQENIEVLAICSATTNATAATWFTNGYGHAQMPSDGMKMLWPMTATATGAPIRVNSTEAWWVGPDTVSTGETFSIFGRNLGTNCRAYIDGHGWLTNTACNPCKADFTVPALSNGTYSVYAHNGLGRKYGWADPLELTVTTGNDWSVAVIDVTDPLYGAVGDGVTDDLIAIIDAIDICPSNGTVYFPAGTYALSARITTSLSNKRLLGDGPTQSVITAHSTYSEGSGNGLLHSSPSNAEFRDLGFSQGAGKVSKVLRLRSMDRVRFVNCRFDDLDGALGAYTATLDFEGGRNVTLKGCDIITYRGCSFPYNTGLRIQNCRFRGWGDSDCGYMFTANANDRLLVENCTATHYDDSSYTNGWGWCQGRFITLSGNYGANRHTYIGGCSTTNMGVRFNFDESRWYTGHAHYNAGEQILTEHQRTLERLEISVGTSNTVTCPDIIMPNYVGYTVKVLDGPLSNQTRTVVSTDPEAWTLNVDSNWVQVDSAKRPASGEHVLLNGAITQEVAGAEDDSVSLRHTLPGLMATIVKGKGFGQSRSIVSADRATTGVVTVGQPWNVAPGSNSVVAIGRYVSRMAVFDNDLDGRDYETKPYGQSNDAPPYSTNTSPVDTASCGVSLYGGGSECVVLSNRFTDVISGVLLWGYVDDSTLNTEDSVVQPSGFNLVYDNTISNARHGISMSSYHPDGPPYQPDRISFGHIVRNNELDTLYQSVFSVSTVTNIVSTELTVWEHNTAANVHSNFWSAQDGINTYTNNNTEN